MASSCIFASCFSIFFFFFQAEDGIRDRNVTGVQTCALPISQSLCGRARFGRADTCFIGKCGEVIAQQLQQLLRSEERRVGKECRSRWSRCHEKKKKITERYNVQRVSRVHKGTVNRNVKSSQE